MRGTSIDVSRVVGKHVSRVVGKHMPSIKEQSRVETRPPEIVFTEVNTGVGNYFQSAIVQPLLDIISLHITPSARMLGTPRSHGEGFPLLVWPPDMTHNKGIGTPKSAQNC